MFCTRLSPPLIWSAGIKSAPDSPDDSGIELLDIAVEPTQGDVYVVTNCYTPCTFAPGIVFTPASTLTPFTVLAKYDYLGNFKWANNLGFINSDYASVHICSAAQDGVYITSPFAIPEVSFGNGIKVTQSCPTNCTEVFLAKIGSNGLANWAKTVHGNVNGTFSAAGIEADESGTLYLAGNYTGSTVNFGGNFIVNNLPGAGFFLATYSSAAGVPQAAYFAAPTSGPARAQHLAVNDNDQLVLAGAFNGTFSNFANGLSINAPIDADGYFVAGLNSDGTAQWVHEISSSDYSDILGIDIDQEGQAYVAVDASVDLRVDNTTLANISTNYAGSVVKMGPGDISLPVYIGYNTDDYAVMDVKLDNNGIIYTAGYTSIPLTIGSTNVTVDGCLDGLLTATRNDGVHQWARSVGGSGCEGIVNNRYAASIAFDGVGFMHVTGLFYNGFEEEGHTLPDQGCSVAKFNTSIVGTDEPASIGNLQSARIQMQEVFP